MGGGRKKREHRGHNLVSQLVHVLCDSSRGEEGREEAEGGIRPLGERGCLAGPLPMPASGVSQVCSGHMGQEGVLSPEGHTSVVKTTMHILGLQATFPLLPDSPLLAWVVASATCSGSKHRACPLPARSECPICWAVSITVPSHAQHSSQQLGFSPKSC